MATRYAQTPLLGGADEPLHYGSYELPDILTGLSESKILDDVETELYEFVEGDRLDKISQKFYGSSEYWWTIALINGIVYPLGIEPGTKLTIPVDISIVYKRLVTE